MSDRSTDITDPKLRGHVPRHVARIVEQQVGRWRLHESSGDYSPTHWSLITISQEFGAHGEELGKRLADTLGFSYWDHQIVTSIAQALRIDEPSIEQFDEHARGVIEDLLAVTIFGQGLAEADYGDQLRHLFRVIQARGAAVIVGRGAHCVVDPVRALRVRVVCPMARRVADYRACTGVTEQAAIRQIRAADHDRAEFIRREFGSNVAETTEYDIVINSAVYESTRAEALVLMAYMAKFGRLPSEARDSFTNLPAVQPVAEPMRTTA